MKISKYVKVDQNILLEYIYDDGNLISEPYKILVNIKNNSYSYIASDTSQTINKQTNQLFNIDPVANKYGIVDTTNYNFLQTNDYAAGFPLRHDTINIHIPTNYTFGEHIGCYIRVYTFDYNNQNTFEISNFFFDITNTNTSNLLNYTSPPLFFQEKQWGKHLQLVIPSVYALSSQRTNGVANPNSVNSNLTKGVGLSLNSPIFIDFQFIDNIQVINNITTYLLASKVTTSFSQAPDFEGIGVQISESVNGDFFEINGLYNSSITGFNDFINSSVSLGNRYYVEFGITLYEQNVRGKTLTVIITDDFNEPVEYRPIIKYSTTTAIIDVEMKLIDAVDSSQIIRRASFGMLPNQVSKYSLNLSKINLDNANKPKIYNIKSPIGAGIFGRSGTASNILSNTSPVSVQPVKVPFPVLIDKFGVVAKSDNVKLGKDLFYGIGKLEIMIYPFDNIIKIIIATNIDPTTNSPLYMDMSNMGEINFVIKNSQVSVQFLLYTDSGEVNLSQGVTVFKIDSNKINDIRKVFNSGINVFYITSTQNNVTTVIYSGLFNMYDSSTNITDLNNIVSLNQSSIQANSSPSIIPDNNTQNGVAIVTRKIVNSPGNVKNTTSSPVVGTVSNNITSGLSATASEITINNGNISVSSGINLTRNSDGTFNIGGL